MRRLIFILAFCLGPLSVAADEQRPRYRNAMEAAAAASAFNAANVGAWGANPPVPYRAISTNRIVLYRAGCAYECQSLVGYLQMHNIPFVVRDAERNAYYRNEYTRIGGTGMPLVLIGGSPVNSLDGALIAQRYVEIQHRSGWPPAPSKSGKRPIEEGDLLKPRIDGVALYAEPDSASSQIRTLTTKENCVYLGEEEGDYCRITCKADTGWIDRRLVRR